MPARCNDAERTGITGGGVEMTCSELKNAGGCMDADYGARIRGVCPRACGTGECAPLADAELRAWKNLYDATGGTATWTRCGGAEYRDDPCACDDQDPDGYNTVTCTAGGHVTILYLQEAGLLSLIHI